MVEPTTPVPNLEIHGKEDDDYLSTKEQEMLRSLEEASCKAPATPLIRRVTQILRDNEAITNSTIAIGPIHHDDSPNSKYKRAEIVKCSLAAKFIGDSGTTKKVLYKNVRRKLESFYDPQEIMKWENHDEDLALMFLVDGCAVLHFIHLDSNSKFSDLGFKNDLLAFTRIDLFLLENQLPYKLLELLMKSCIAAHSKALKESIIVFIMISCTRPSQAGSGGLSGSGT